MEFYIRNVDFKADQWEVTKAIAGQALHVCPGPFVSSPEERLPNFKATLNASKAGGVQNDGSGTFTVTKPVGKTFKRLNEKDQINVVVKGKRLKFIPNTNTAVGKSLSLELEKAPFIDPDIAKDRQTKIKALTDPGPFLVMNVQIGTFYQPKDARPRDPRAFSIEWDQDLRRRSMGWLFFNYEHKCLRIQIGDQTQEETFYNLSIQFASINKMAMGHDFGNPYICFDLLRPPVIHKEEIFRSLPGSGEKEKRFQHRVGSLNPGHAAVAHYAHHLRIVLHDDSDCFAGDSLQKFESYCRLSMLRPPNKVPIDANGGQRFFCSKNLNEIAIWLRSPMLSSNWRVAFQIAALLHNGTANTVELVELRPQIEDLIRHQRDSAGDIMRRFAEAAAHRPLGQRVSDCFKIILQTKLRRTRSSPPRGRFFCYHVTVTPTRLLLEGPTITQSNRVIRQYERYEDHFLRVDFRDEDRLPYRWDRFVDGESYLQERVGTMLKTGLDLAGRHFDFLGYSSSALREHAVWFFNAFHHPDVGLVTAQSIRGSLGDFSGVITSPSKYGARMAQAFSATDPSVRISRDQWSLVPDIEENGVNFSDGVGTISPELAKMIWEALSRDNPAPADNSTGIPSAYQIRFLGCKGVVSVDKRLEGIHMCIRPSMNKFDVPGEEYGTIEIANAADKPRIPHLNRSLVMVLEDRGTPKEAFLKLQNETVADVRMAHDSAARFAGLLESHHLSYNYRLADILKKLNTLGLELKPNHLQQPLDTPFFARLRACAINHVLRSVKHDARIPIPNSHMLMGVADEGPVYVKKGLNNVYCLPQGKIFACVQRPEDKEPTYLKGMCLISRSPVVHPGDVQRVYAIGQPPADQECLFGHLKNVVVFSSTGNWSLPNGLAGGDLDGDLYDIIQYGELLVPEHHDPASYPPGETRKLDRPSTIDDICNFIVEYIYSDVVGLVADKHIVIADQSKHGTLDPDCLLLAELHSQAVDYPKNGNKVDLERLPRQLIQFKPDWKKAEEDVPRSSDYYESTRALGYLYRNITLEAMPNPPSDPQGKAEEHPIFKALWPHVRRHLYGLSTRPASISMDTLYMAYRAELSYIASTYSLSPIPGSRLREEELVVGTILAKCTVKRYRSGRLYAMRESMAFLVQDTKGQLVGRLEELTESALKEKLAVAWSAWIFSRERTASSPPGESFGSESFGLIGLELVLRCLDMLGSLPPL